VCGQILQNSQTPNFTKINSAALQLLHVDGRQTQKETFLKGNPSSYKVGHKIFFLKEKSAVKKTGKKY
jgi:hypothetical protein